MCIKPGKKAKRGLTFVEVMIAAGLFGLTSLVLATLYMFSMRTFASTANYTALDNASRLAVDQLTYELRQAKDIVECSTNPPGITFVNVNDIRVEYTFESETRQLVRSDETGNRRVLLEDCDIVQFQPRQRNPIPGSFDEYPAAPNNRETTLKAVQLTWRTSRRLPNGLVNSENVQTAKIVIRKQSDN